MKIIDKIRFSTYIKQILTLLSGVLISQVVILGYMPMLTRLYSPDEFGVYSLFLSVTGVLGGVSSLTYDKAIMLPKSDKDAQALVLLSVLLTIGMVGLVTLVLLLFQNYIIDYFDGLTYVVWMIPLGVFLFGLLLILNAYSSRSQFYKKMATVRIAGSLTLVNFQSISKYLLKLDGLIIGKVLGDIVSVFMLFRVHLIKKTIEIKSLSKKLLCTNAKRFDNFPKYESLNVFLNAISQNIPILLFTSLYSVEIAGFYALTARILHAPIGMIGGSTRQVYYQRASKMYASGENIFNLYIRTTLGLLKLIIIPFFVILFFGDYLFIFIFSEEWSMSGKMAQVLIVWFLLAFINSPSVMTYSILNLQKVQMRLEIISLFMRFSSIYAGFYFFDSYWVSIILFVISSVIYNIFMILYIYLKLKER